MNPQTHPTAKTAASASVGRLFLVFAVPIVAMCLISIVDRSAALKWIDKDLLGKISASGYILAAALLFYHLACTLLIDRVLASSRKRPLPRLLRHLVTIGIATMAVLMVAFTLAPKAFSGILALSGILGVVLGLALKPLILDVFSGISTNLDSAFQIGDWIEIGTRSDGQPHAGWVEEINWRTTHVRTRTGNLIICPNSIVSTAVIGNFSRPWPLSRVDAELCLPAELEVSRALRVLKAALDATVGMDGGPSDEREGEVLLKEITAGMAIYQLRCWIDYSQLGAPGVRHLVLCSALRHLRIAGIPIAEPAVMNLTSRVILDNAASRNFPILLSHIELFKGMDDEDLREIAASLVVLDFTPLEVLVRQGEEGSEMFVIIEGAVEVLADVDGREVRVATMQAGDYFGEMSLLTGEPRTATVRATTKGRLWRIPREGVARVLTGDAPMMDIVSRNLAARNLNRSTRVEESQASTAEEQTRSQAAGLLAKMMAVFRTTR
jgi:small-conductance mechanosensitive channel/CRP-like cAMP-binding protein